jgi:phosphoribosylaminoimidazole synthetase
LIRKIVEKKHFRWDDPAPWKQSASVGEEFLVPTRIYVKPLLKVSNKGLVKGMSHITGGGIIENVPRMLPEHLAAEIDLSLWPLPPIFKWLKQAGNVASTEFGRTWNTGLGFVIVVSQGNREKVIDELKVEGENAFVVGKLVSIVPSVSSRLPPERCILTNFQCWD